MKIFSWDQAPFGNIGDDINHWLWPKVFQGYLEKNHDVLLVGIGSVLTKGFNRDHFSRYKRKILLGAGTRGDREGFDLSREEWHVGFVRGKKTARVFGLEEKKAISDPAILVSHYWPDQQNRHRTGIDLPKNPQIGLIPYWRTTASFGEAVASVCGFQNIPVWIAPKYFFRRLLNCDAVFAEAMHGAILADALGVPWIPCRFSNVKTEGATHAFKWKDWLDTLELHPEFFSFPVTGRIPGSSCRNDLAFTLKVRLAAGQFRKILKNSLWNLSDRELLAHRQEQMLNVIETCKQELQ